MNTSPPADACPCGRDRTARPSSARRWPLRALVCLLTLPLLAHAATRTMQDMTGATVQLPVQPSRIADLWFAHNELVVMLGGAEHIKMTVDRPQTTPWMFKLAPILQQATQVRGEANPEALLAERIDLAFVSSTHAALPFRRLGIPTLAMSFQDVEGLKRAVSMTAQALNTPQAQAIAARYNRQLEQVIGELQQRLGDLPAGQRPSVLHIESLQPLQVDGGDTLIDQWIRLAGGRNAATGVKGSKQPVNLEQILAWQPDIIIIGSTVAGTGQVTRSHWWQALSAVRQGRVYRDPLGIFLWDRYGTEFMLQLQWAASILHPDRCQDIDIAARARRFYADYFNHHLSDAELQRMLQGLPPIP